MSMDLYYAGRLSEATAALAMPVMAVEAQANAVYRCAKDARATDISRSSLVADIDRLERALSTLREALDVGMAVQPLRLVAAE